MSRSGGPQPRGTGHDSEAVASGCEAVEKARDTGKRLGPLGGDGFDVLAGADCIVSTSVPSRSKSTASIEEPATGSAGK